ncbi:MAG: diguanylate cyclase, partial [Thiohalocapsa sp.]
MTEDTTSLCSSRAGDLSPLPMAAPADDVAGALRDYLKGVLRCAGIDAGWLLVQLCEPFASDPFFVATSVAEGPVAETTESRARAIVADICAGGSPDRLRLLRRGVYSGYLETEGTRLFRVPRSDGCSPVAAVGRASAQRVESSAAVGNLWIGLCCSDSAEAMDGSSAVCGQDTIRVLEQTPGTLVDVIGAGAQMAQQLCALENALKDPITGLARRSEFNAAVARTLSADGDGVWALLLINPDEFELVNERLGRGGGDRALREIGLQLREQCGPWRSAYHFGSAVFAVFGHFDDARGVLRGAEELRSDMSSRGYLGGTLRLKFSGGVCCVHPNERDDDLDDGEVVQRAWCALKASKVAGGSRAMVWGKDAMTGSMDAHDRLSGIFTADARKDYRNMLLRWETVQDITAHDEPAELSNAFLECIRSIFKPARAALIEQQHDGGSRVVGYAGDRIAEGIGTSAARMLEPLPAALRRLVERAWHSSR